MAKEIQSLRIAVISSTAPPTSGGGVGTAHYNLFRGLREKGLNAELFLFFQRGAVATASADELEKYIHRFGPPARLRKALLTINNWVFAILSPGKMAWNTADIVTSAIGVRRMNRSLKEFNADVIIFPDHGAPGLFIQHQKDARIHLIAHHNPARLTEPLLGNYSRLDARIAVWLEQRVLRNVRKVVCPSHHMRTWFAKTYRFEGPVKVIPNVIFKDDILPKPTKDLRATMGLPADVIVIGIPSAQTAVKGARLLAEIIRSVAAATPAELGFFLAGEIDKEVAAELERLPKNARLYAPGRLAHDEYLAAFSDCSFGIFPSLRDNYSMALVEASVLGVPMLAFDAGGNADIIVDGSNGRLIQDLDAQAVTMAAVQLIREPQALRALRESTRQYARSHFDAGRTIDEYIDFLLK
ncbi:MAG: glycosyltransferase family 4 protein [Anaerolineales bacterium]